MAYVLRSTDFKYGTLKCQDQIILHEPQPLLLALKRFGLCFLGAILCLPFPGIHFALVPGFLLFGIFQFFQALKFKAKLVGVETTCPTCQAKASYKVLYIAEEKNLFCKNCRTQLRILPEDTARPAKA